MIAGGEQQSPSPSLLLYSFSCVEIQVGAGVGGGSSGSKEPPPPDFPPSTQGEEGIPGGSVADEVLPEERPSISQEEVGLSVLLGGGGGEGGAGVSPQHHPPTHQHHLLELHWEHGSAHLLTAALNSNEVRRRKGLQARSLSPLLPRRPTL